MASVDHRVEQDQRWAQFVTLACPSCLVEVFVLDIPVPVVWCAACPSTPRLERVAA